MSKIQLNNIGAVMASNKCNITETAAYKKFDSTIEELNRLKSEYVRIVEEKDAILAAHINDIVAVLEKHGLTVTDLSTLHFPSRRLGGEGHSFDWLWNEFPAITAASNKEFYYDGHMRANKSRSKDDTINKFIKSVITEIDELHCGIRFITSVYSFRTYSYRRYDKPNAITENISFSLMVS